MEIGKNSVGHSSKCSKIDDNPVVGGDKKVDGRINSGDKNVIGPKCQIGGNSTLGDNSGNSDKIDDNPVLDNNNNTKSNNNKGGDKIMENFLPVGSDLSGYELDFRIDSGDKNIIGANSQIQGNSIVGDGSGNNTMNSYEKGQPQQQTQQQQQKKGGGNNSNNNVGANYRPIKL